MSKLLIIGDSHFSEHLSYYNVVKDGRESEKKEVLDFIVKTFFDNKCEGVIFLGDQFDKKNNPSPVIKEFTNFIERFGNSKVYIIAGNHEKTASGDSALDYLKEISGKNWKIITNNIEYIDGMVFCPYLYKSELGVTTDEDAIKELHKRLLIPEIINTTTPLFVHFGISDTLTTSGQNTKNFHEPVLNDEFLHNNFNPVFGGHIHKPTRKKTGGGETIVAGSVFNEEVGENGKKIYILNTDDNAVEEIKLPGRGVYKLENPNEKDVKEISNNSIVKIYISDRKIDIDKTKELLKSFDGYVIVEQYPNERRKVTYGDELMDLSLENLFKMYSSQKKIPIEVIMEAWDKIK